MASRRVVVVCPIMPVPVVGGGHKRTLRLMEAIETAGGVPHLLTTDVGQPGGADELRGRGWAAETIPEPPGTLSGRAHQQLARLPSPYVPALGRRIGELVAEGCAFVQVEHVQCAYYGDALAGAPWVLSLHNVDSQMMRSVARSERPLSAAWLRAWNRWHALRAMERRSVPAATATLCVSEQDRAALLPLRRDVVVAANGVDDDVFGIEPELPAEERLLFFGRFDYSPNAHGIARFLREGWPRLAAERPAARLRLVGGGMDAGLRELAQRSPGVEAVGFVEDLVAELASARVAIVPIWSGGGTRLKVLESLAAARPVVGTALGVGGLGFRSDAHGLIAESPADLAAGVAALLADPERSARLAAGGRELAQGFRWERTLAPARSLFERLLVDSRASTAV